MRSKPNYFEVVLFCFGVVVAVVDVVYVVFDVVDVVFVVVFVLDVYYVSRVFKGVF